MPDGCGESGSKFDALGGLTTILELSGAHSADLQNVQKFWQGGPVQDGLRERKKARTRSTLQRSALWLAVQRGADKITVADIAAAADVSPRTFFNYFSSREEALVADDLDRGQRFVAAVAAAPEGAHVWSALREAAVEAFGSSVLPRAEEALKQQLVRSSPEVLACVLATFDPLERQLVHELGRRLAPSSTLLPHLLSNAVLAAVRAAIETWLEAEDADFREVLGTCFDVLAPAFVNTVAPPKVTLPHPEACQS